VPGNATSGPENVTLPEREGYLEARVGGTYALERLKQQATAIFRACKERGFRRLLFDVSSMRAFESMGTLERFELGAHAVRVGRNQITVAVLGTKGQFDDEGFGAQVARNRGMRVQMFTDPKAAVTWLTTPAAKAGG
jgi:hypothetical protein